MENVLRMNSFEKGFRKEKEKERNSFE